MAEGDAEILQPERTYPLDVISRLTDEDCSAEQIAEAMKTVLRHPDARPGHALGMTIIDTADLVAAKKASAASRRQDGIPTMQDIVLANVQECVRRRRGELPGYDTIMNDLDEIGGIYESEYGPVPDGDTFDDDARGDVRTPQKFWSDSRESVLEKSDEQIAHQYPSTTA